MNNYNYKHIMSVSLYKAHYTLFFKSVMTDVAILATSGHGSSARLTIPYDDITMMHVMMMI